MTDWNHLPPAAPPTTDAAPRTGGSAVPSTGGHGNGQGAEHPPGAHTQAPQQMPTIPPAAPTSTTHGEPQLGASDPVHWSGAPTPPPLPPQASTSRPSRGGGARVALLAAAVAGLMATGFVARGLVDEPNSVSAQPTTAAAGPASTVQPDTPLLSGADEEPVAAVAKALGPSVVVIKTDDGLGSGVVYDDTGLIVTNAHVVGSSTTVKVTLDGGQTIDGSVVGADTVTDIAVVRVTGPSNLKAARLAADPPEVGDLTVALGSPFGLERTVTAGIVSAVDRPVSNDTSGNGTGGVVNMIQTDAPINPGNSGGALANRKGEVIGINSMIFSESGDNAGIGFAIPIAKAKAVADALVSGGSLPHAQLGVGLDETTDGSPGAQVQAVSPGSAAEASGLQQGDVITSVDGKAMKTYEDVAGAIGAKAAGDTIQLTITRNGSSSTVTVTLDAKPTTPPTSAPSSGSGSGRGTPRTTTP